MSTAASGVWKPRTALAAYRALLRAQRELFANDAAALASAHAETRSAFLQQAAAKPEDVPALVEDAFEASMFIRQNVAQAELNERGHYGASPRPAEPFIPSALLIGSTCRSSLPRARRAQSSSGAHSHGLDTAAAPVQGGFQQVTSRHLWMTDVVFFLHDTEVLRRLVTASVRSTRDHSVAF